MTRGTRRAVGFTLIELMIGVAIVGLMASVAIPNYARLTARSKSAERAAVMKAILRGIENLYVRNGSVVVDGTAPNPATYGLTKHALDPLVSPGWRTLLNTIEIDGRLYYSYQFTAWESAPPAPAGAQIIATGDLDGDGIPSTKTLNCLRIENAAYQCTEDPLAGEEDAHTF
jgi:prepilin-type N-terminal cleavage/methylation domain-containing protein